MSKLMPLSMMVFAAGLIALAAVFALRASGVDHLPVWLDVTSAMLVPLGITMGLISVFRGHERD
ncbi:MAG: hypothetical protein JOZ47_01870 [Kutzneria sp.]|nr:hypothetical protein [Kutzneria sp.]